MELPLTTIDDVAKKRRRRKICAVILVVVILAGGLTAILLNRESRFWSSSEVYNWNYEEVSKATVSEVQADLVVYRHKKTKTQIISLVPTDTTQDKVFGISFRTLPSTSNGAAHVLEHAVLSGSAKYPAKDPFNVLKRGSLQTFLNAMTYPDRTIYLISSRNHADYRNLMSVYLDAVFKPRVVTDKGLWVLRQEGWRVEEKGDEELEFNGVVMSEMKGVYSDPEQLLATYSQTALFPDTPYRHDSGGEPSTIPSLTHEHLIEFYEKFYHPTNAQIFLYGSKTDIKAGLEQADEYLQQYEARSDIRKESKVPWQKKNFQKPLKVRRSYPSSEEDDGDYKVMITWLINDEEMDAMTEAAWYVLDFLLLGTPTSALQKALITSDLGDYVIDDGFDTQLVQYTYQVGLEGLENEAGMAEVEKLIMDTLKQVVENGFKPIDITSAVNNVEFQIRELDMGDYPRGIGLLLDGLSKWNYDRDPLSGLQLQGALEELKDIVAESGSDFFVHMVKSLLQNHHRVILELAPDTGLAQKTETEEQAQLNAIRQNPKQLEQLIMEYDNMKEVQAKDDPPAVLAAIPSLSLEDLDRHGDEYPITVENDAGGSGVTVLTHEVPTSFGIAYIDFGLDISAVGIEDIHLLPLLSRLMLENGKDTPDGDLHLQRQIASHTGGIDLYPLVDDVRPDGLSDDHYVVLDGSHLSTKLFLRGKCTPENAHHLFTLYKEILLEGTLDSKSKTISVLKEMISDLQYSLGSDGDDAANLRIKSRYSVVGYIFEELNGVTSMEKLSDALNMAKTDWSSLLARLEGIKTAILKGHRNGMVLNLTGDKNVLASIKSIADKFLEKDLPPRVNATEFIDYSKEDHPWFVPVSEQVMLLSKPPADEAFVIPTQVSYVGKGGMLYQHGERLNGSDSVVSNYISRGYLFEELRVQRGAYGATSRLDIRSGTLVFTSYRDPNLASTLDVYNKTAATLKSEMKITRSSNPLPPKAADAIIGTIGSLDGTAPQPGDVGWYSLRQWLRGESAELRQNWRNQILDTKWEDFGAFADRLASMPQPSIAAVTSQSEYQEAVSKGYNLKRISPLADTSSS